MMINITLTIIMTVMTILIIPLVVMISLISGLADTTSFSWRLAPVMTMTRPQLQSEEQ